MLEVDFSFGIKINPALFVALAEDDAFPFRKIDIRAIEVNQFSDADPGGNKEIDDGEIAGVAALITELFKILI